MGPGAACCYLATLALHWRKAPRSLLHLVISRPGTRTEKPPSLSLSSQHFLVRRSLKVVTSHVSDKHHSARRGSPLKVVLQL